MRVSVLTVKLFRWFSSMKWGVVSSLNVCSIFTFLMHFNILACVFTIVVLYSFPVPMFSFDFFKGKLEILKIRSIVRNSYPLTDFSN